MKMLLEVRYCIVFVSKTRIPLRQGQVKAACLEVLLGNCETATFSIPCIFFHGFYPLLESNNILGLLVAIPSAARQAPPPLFSLHFWRRESAPK
ncbi:hypothetical protein OU994_07030 [Pseudoduganella sp. SL102]|uniref:hypothetical protein n=1 Tax=Pseudoduganella sp. SL102 TaxID=2995154 RepID=UPI00248AAB60|nr:hypothetical protein [Pseudoduganella sp. SL102]WBS04036.1 hypothetical protein OU994_07030 [Pseudoduganella sp. SL102]